MYCLKQHFSINSRDTRRRVRADILAGIQHGTSSFESFNYVAGVSHAHLVAGGALPDGELLHKPRTKELAFVTGGSVEDFYKLCHCLGLDENVDKLILEKLLPESLKYKKGVSINLCSRTAYNKKFPEILDQIEHEPQKVVFEISEAKVRGRSRIPAEYNPKAIAALRKNGYRFAMDDLDPLRSDEWQNLGIFDTIDAVKFSHEIASLMRKGDDQIVDKVTHHIWAVSRLCPSAILIMEGIRATDQKLLQLLADAGVHAYQKSRYIDDVNVQPELAGLELIL